MGKNSMLFLLYKIVSECRSESMQEDGCEKIIRERFYLLTTNWKLKTLSKFFCQNYFSQRKCVTRHHLIPWISASRYVIYYCRLSHNGHLKEDGWTLIKDTSKKTDTLVKQTLAVGSCLTLLSFIWLYSLYLTDCIYSYLYKYPLSLVRDRLVLA